MGLLLCGRAGGTLPNQIVRAALCGSSCSVCVFINVFCGQAAQSSMSTKSNVGPTRKHPAASLGPTRKRPAASGGSRATGVLEPSSSSTGALEIDLGQLYDAAVKNATRGDEEFLQKLRALGHYPRESRSAPKEEQQLEMQARNKSMKIIENQ